MVFFITLIWCIKVDAAMIATFNTQLDPTGSSTSTNVMGISGTHVVGFDKLSPDTGFAYTYNSSGITSGSSTTPIQRPLGMDGDIIVGTSNNNADSYYYNTNGGGLQDIPLVNSQPRDISGNLIVGSQSSSSFIFDITGTDTPTGSFVGAEPGNENGLFKHPNGDATRAWGIDGNVIVGEAGNSGFIFTYNGLPGQITGSWQLIDDSTVTELTGTTRVNVQGVSGDYVSGFYDDVDGTHGFFYNYIEENQFTTIVAPEPTTFMQARAIEGDIIAGSYKTAGGVDVGFLYQIPEPSMFTLCASPILLLFLRRRRN